MKSLCPGTSYRVSETSSQFYILLVSVTVLFVRLYRAVMIFVVSIFVKLLTECHASYESCSLFFCVLYWYCACHVYLLLTADGLG
jgi:hypothetical protein